MMRLDETKGQNSLPGPKDIFRKTLPNGITILTRSNFNSPSVVISGYVAVGSQFAGAAGSVMNTPAKKAVCRKCGASIDD